MDGTLCDVSGIRHLVTGPVRNFDAFHRASLSCPPHDWVVDAAREKADQGLDVLIVTARSFRYQRVTGFWLALHDVPSAGVWLRPDGDYRPDAEVKRDIFTHLMTWWDIEGAHDDNPSVLALEEDLGIPTVRVPGWEEQWT